MSFSLRHSAPPLLHQPDFNDFREARVSKVSTSIFSPKLKKRFPMQNRFRSFCSVNADNSPGRLSGAHNCSPSDEGSKEKTESSQGELSSLHEILKKLRRYGISGILSYGLLNTAYYLTTFLLVCVSLFLVAPGKMGYLAAVERFLKVMAMVWAGSQVTKLLRAAGALALAPLVDRGLAWFTVEFKFESQAKAFMAIVGSCFGLAVILFLVVTLLWA